MFDPTIFDNMKVVLEGAVYDLDFAGKIVITGRIDRVELSTMSRTYAVMFREQGITANTDCTAEVRLAANISDLAAELLQMKDVAPGCQLHIRFRCYIRGMEDCLAIERRLHDIWNERPHIQQTISFVFDADEKPTSFLNEVELDFARKLDESQVDDFPELLRYVLKSLQALNRLDH